MAVVMSKRLKLMVKSSGKRIGKEAFALLESSIERSIEAMVAKMVADCKTKTIQKEDVPVI